MKAKTQECLLDVVLIFSSGEAFSTKETVRFIFSGTMKQLEIYINNICKLWSFRLDAVVSVYDVYAGKYLIKLEGLK